MSLYKQIFETGVQRNPAGAALQCDKEKYSYEELQEKVTKLAEEFEKAGIGRNCKVVLKIKHPLKFTLSLLALTYLDAIPMPIYHGMGNEKLSDLCDMYDVNYVLGSAEDLQLASLYQKTFELPDVVAGYKVSGKTDPSLEGTKMILFTSGTTSMPKAIMLTEENICSNVRSISEYLKLTTRDKILLIKDLSHSSSIIGELFVGLFNGCSIMMTTRLLRAVTIMSLMQEQRTTVFFAVPTLLKEIMASSKRKEYDISSLRIINFYGASMNKKDIVRLIEMFPDTNVIYSYGQTEASPRVTYIEKEMLAKRPASCGRPISGVTIAIVDDAGMECAPYVKGEITVQGPNVMRGYYRNEEKTKTVLRDGKLYTGDMAYLDEEGFLYVVGRMDNMFTRGGKNIYPEEIEGVLLSHQDVLEVLVEPRSKEGDAVDIVAYIVLKDNVQFDADKLWSYCKGKLEDYKVPKELKVVTTLVKTPSGKIKRKQFV